MNAPLPEVPPPPAPKKRDFAKAPLPLLNWLCAAKAAVALLYALIHTPIPDIPRSWDWPLHVTIVVLSWLLIYGLWRGYGLARGLWLWISVLSLWVLVFPSEDIEWSRAERIVGAFDWALVLFSIVWLNLPGVKAHFARRKEPEEAVKSP